MRFDWLKGLIGAGRPPQAPPVDEALITERFLALYYERHAHTWDNTYWQGVKVLKCPLDLWIYQEIVFETQPDLIIETGTRFGGSALYLASLCDMAGRGEVISIDLEHPAGLPQHPRLRYLTGSSVSPDVLEAVARAVAGRSRVMVVLDSDHTRAHVAAELAAYERFVTVGNYLVVEDTIVNGHPVLPAFGEGPMEAVAAFLDANDHFVSDRAREKLMVTFNPRGYLLKTREAPAPTGP